MQTVAKYNLFMSQLNINQLTSGNESSIVDQRQAVESDFIESSSKWCI